MISEHIKARNCQLRSYYKGRLLKQDDWILGRVACLGQDVLELIAPKKTLWNIQKGRVDYLNGIIKSTKMRARPERTINFLDRSDIAPLIVQQWNVCWLGFRKPSVIYMDSFSELTDQLFSSRQGGWNFCCNYSDLFHTDLFNDSFESLGLLELGNLEIAYRAFFNKLRLIYGDVPIIFLHFPVKLDSRKKYYIRFEAILSCIEKLADEDTALHSVSIEDSIVDWPEVKIANLKDFPYHYNSATYEEFRRKIESLNVI